MISEQALTVLNKSRVEGNLLRLPPTQLDRKLYLEVNEILARLGGEWKGGKVKAHVFDKNLHIDELLGSVIDSKEMPDQNVLAYFRTPDDLADRMVALLKEEPHIVLEPSAGDGSILDALGRKYSNADYFACELDETRAKILGKKGYEVLQKDFLGVDVGSTDTVLMNPPFSVKSDALAYITHINRAWKWIEKEVKGQLVAIAPPGFTFRQDKRSREFLEFVEANGSWEDLPEGTFKESGSSIKTVMINLTKGN